MGVVVSMVLLVAAGAGIGVGVGFASLEIGCAVGSKNCPKTRDLGQSGTIVTGVNGLQGWPAVDISLSVFSPKYYLFGPCSPHSSVDRAWLGAAVVHMQGSATSEIRLKLEIKLHESDLPLLSKSHTRQIKAVNNQRFLPATAGRRSPALTKPWHSLVNDFVSSHSFTWPHISPQSSVEKCPPTC